MSRSTRTARHSLQTARKTAHKRHSSDSSLSSPPVISISSATFHRHHPSSFGHGKPTSSNPPLFPNLTFSLPSSSVEPCHWSILGPSLSGKTTFLQILRGQHLCLPPKARSYPYLDSDDVKHKNTSLRSTGTAIQYVGFGGEQGDLGSQSTKGAYMSARYESRRELTDFSVLDYLKGNTQLNASEDSGKHVDPASLTSIIRDLRLVDLIDMPVSNLSNGQTRRAKIAKALLGRPEVLLLDEPFMGLDPQTVTTLSPLLHSLARSNAPRVVLSLRLQDPIPEWITHLICLKPTCEIAYMGKKTEVLDAMRLEDEQKLQENTGRRASMPVISGYSLPHKITNKHPNMQESKLEPPGTSDTNNMRTISVNSDLETLVEMSGVKVSYGSKTVLGDWRQTINGTEKEGLYWTVKRGQRWGIFGANGSGKTTILSLICSDHPQTYSLPILLFGRSRLPEPGKPGISVFDLQARIGHSSPEIHHHMPRQLNLRQTLASAWADTFLSKAKLDDTARQVIDQCLQWFEPELRPGRDQPHNGGHSTAWADDLLFGGLSFSSQRIALFLRALIKKADLVILDEAFSGMDESMRDKCMHFLHHGIPLDDSSDPNGTMGASKQGLISGLEERQALLCISHVKEEIPDCVREWICLPEANTGAPARMGRLSRPLGEDGAGWREIWAM